MQILQVDGLSHSFGERDVLRNLSLSIDAGESVALLGANGSGKSTLLRLVAGLLTPTAGQIALVGSAAAAGRTEVGIVFQEAQLLPWRTVLRNVTLPLELAGESLTSARAAAEAALVRVGAGGLLDRSPSEISGGERGRVALARALVRRPSLLLLDEPFAGIDPIAVEDIQRIVRELRDRDGLAILITDHSVRETLSITDRAFLIHDGRVILEGASDELVNDPIARKHYLGDDFRM